MTTLSDAIAKQAKEQAAKAKKKTTKKQMKVKLAILAVLVIAGGCGAQKYNQFKNSPTGKVIEQLQERKELIEEFTKSPLQIPSSTN